MRPSLPNPQLGMFGERLTMMKIITSVGLALLLFVGFVASTTHTKAEGPVAAPLAAAAMHEAYADAVGSFVAEDSALGWGTAIASVEDDSLLATGLCLLGLLCGLVLALLIRASLRRKLIPDPLSHALEARILNPLVPRARVSSLTLTQLGLSRT